eukprot:CAMPEP_0206247698 /NCGR_PEP_ID=MMETSP0047_2-20121206/19961_1 /ASSEMBLY_ACC=CAM_ASM_000192 /TAXON_ID=195065 /ORGANISM="Chroomonas mesostigmatica_cf, Strain CCMP1168" /LENGTH=183 /DNA_ID=CAMNT_0053673265 /DNA_START=382 /DNA_END=933 /DNA_ORIENTATION=+
MTNRDEKTFPLFKALKPACTVKVDGQTVLLSAVGATLMTLTWTAFNTIVDRFKGLLPARGRRAERFFSLDAMAKHRAKREAQENSQRGKRGRPLIHKNFDALLIEKEDLEGQLTSEKEARQAERAALQGFAQACLSKVTTEKNLKTILTEMEPTLDVSGLRGEAAVRQAIMNRLASFFVSLLA